MAITSMPGNALQPSSIKGLYDNNYIDFTASTFEQWGQQFLPDVYEKETEIYGNRTISSFLKMVSAELPSSSDQIIWTEQGRLHTRYVNLAFTTASTLATAPISTAGSLGAITAGTEIHFGLFAGATGAQPSAAGSISTPTNNLNLRAGQTVMMAVDSGAGNVSTGDVWKGVVTGASDFSFTFRPYTDIPADTPARDANTRFVALAYGSEFGKATGNFTDKVDPEYSTYQNSPIILKEHYSISGSDASQIGWIEVESENGANGYLWYVKAEHENRLRWEDYLEMSMIEGERYAGSTARPLPQFRSDYTSRADAGNLKGTQGLFAALRERGNVYQDLTGEIGPGTTTPVRTPAARLGAFDNILREFDKNGAIEENMLYVDRDLSLAFDNLLGSQSDFTSNGGGASWGVFNNSQDMALNLGFSGFRRGSYDFYKSDWKYLNDYATRGGFGDIEGVIVPAGTSTVYDQQLGKNIKRPFLHVRYRASETENRKNKSWITGSVGGAYTTDIDELRMHYLSERCLITQGANNFFLLTA